MNKMTDAEVHAFISTPSKTGKLATVRADGRPHCVPVWCCFHSDGIYFMTMQNTVKARNIQRDPRVVITFDHEEFPYDYVMVEGHADVVPVDDAALLQFATEIAARYVPEGQAESFGRRNAVPEELLIRVTPEKYISAKNVAG